MNTAREYIDELRRRAARLEHIARKMADRARRGYALDEAELRELNSAQADMKALRDELNAVMPRVSAEWSGAQDMSLAQLDGCVDEWELRARMGEGAVRRMRDAAEQMKTLNMPERVMAPLDELLERAEAALGAHELMAVSELERQAEPYCELCRLLRAGLEVEQRAGELLERMGGNCPQVEWYLRTRLMHGEDGTPDEAAQPEAETAPKAPLRAKSARAGKAIARKQAITQTRAEPQFAPTTHPARARAGVRTELEQRIQGEAQDGQAMNWRELADEYPEINALSELASGSAHGKAAEPLIQRALEQADALDAIIEDAMMCMGYMAQVHPRDDELAHAWAELVAPDKGEVRRALDIVTGRRREEYLLVFGLCGRVLSRALPNGLYLNGLSALVPGLSAERLLDVVRMIAPCLSVLGRWRALFSGEIALRMRLVGAALPRNDEPGLDDVLTLNEMPLSKNAPPKRWRRVHPQKTSAQSG